MLRSHTVCATPNGGLGGGKSVKKFIEDALAVPTSSAKRAGRRQSCMLRGRRRRWTEQVQGARRRCVGRRRARGEQKLPELGCCRGGCSSSTVVRRATPGPGRRSTRRHSKTWERD